MVPMKPIRTFTTGIILAIIFKQFRPQRSVLDIAIIRLINGEEKVKHFTFVSECLKHDALYVYVCLWVYFIFLN
jgi:hypothetical protein